MDIERIKDLERKKVDYTVYFLFVVKKFHSFHGLLRDRENF